MRRTNEIQNTGGSEEFYIAPKDKEQELRLALQEAYEQQVREVTKSLWWEAWTKGPTVKYASDK